MMNTDRADCPDQDDAAIPMPEAAEDSGWVAEQAADASPVAALTVEIADTHKQVQLDDAVPYDVPCHTVEIADTYRPPAPVLPHPADARARQANLDALSGATFAQYELIRELDRGGMSTVFLARDVRLGRRVAIKFLAQKDAAWADRFKAEARATARCTHDNIVVIYDVGEAFGRLYLALEYLEGVTLRAWLDERRQAASGREQGGASSNKSSSSSPDKLPDTLINQPVLVPPARAAELMIPVVRALAHAHGQGLVHRDLKPDNIMLVESGSIKVLDFGVAKALGDESRTPASAGAVHAWEDNAGLPLDRMFETRAGTVVGTLPYMSPEQWGADRIDERSDLWAVGVMLWEMVTGQHPLAPVSQDRLKTVAQVDLPMPLLSGLRPDLGPIGTIVDSCLRKRKAERVRSASDLLGKLESLVRTAQLNAAMGATDGGEPSNPFAGLAAFQEADASRFFGREQDVASALARLRNRPLVAVSGPSGAGKSSFVRAGLVPALKRSGSDHEVLIVRPGRQPLAALAAALAPLLDRPHSDSDIAGAASARQQVIDTLRTQPGYVGATLRAHARASNKRILLFIDQFEELYTLVADPVERRGFLECLEGVADDASSRLRVVLTLRSDFLDRVAENRAFSSELTRGLSLLSPLGRAELQVALVRPLADIGYRFENDDMVEDMLDSLHSTRSPLPLMQFAASELWDMRDTERKLLTRASYDQLGGIAGALATHADAVLASMSAKELRLARFVLLSLVTEERTRAVVEMSEIRALCRDPDADVVEDIVGQLADARLLLLETDAEHGSTVELSHESLIERWPKLGQWLDEDQEAGRFRALLRGAAREWDKQGRSDDLLWRGRAAEDARRWLTRWRASAGDDSAGDQSEFPESQVTELGTRGLQYLEAVVALAERARKRRRRMLGLAFAFLGVVALAVSLLAVRASREADRAERQAARVESQAEKTRSQAARADREAANARAEALQARNATRMAHARGLISDPTTVLALIRELEPGPRPRGWSELARWALRSGVAEVVLIHPDGVSAAAYSPDGTRIVTVADDFAIRIWRADGTGQPRLLRGHIAAVESAVFSPDGTRIATASADRTARVWNADGSGEPIVLSGHTDRVYRATFSPDGRRVVTASSDRTARVFAVGDTAVATVLDGHTDRVYDAVFSPDGARVATASGDRSARVFFLGSSRPPVVLRGHEHRVYSVEFSPDGARVVTASGDETARVWNLASGGPPVVLRGHEGRVYTAEFSSDGQRIVTGSMDKTARVFRADGTGAPLVLRGHRARVLRAAFSPDGAHVVTASADRSARVWRANERGRSVVFSEHEDEVYSASFSADGDLAVSASADRSVRIWRTDGTGQSIVLRGHTDRVYGAAFSPDGARVVTASGDSTARIFPIRQVAQTGGNRPLLVLSGHGDRVYGAAFSPDGRYIATASGDRTARIWRADGSGQPIVLAGHGERVYGVEFSPDSAHVVTASGDSTARVWRLDRSGPPAVLRGHTDRVNWAAFNPDGTRVITGSRDKTARIWRADGTGDSLVLHGHESVVGVRGGGAFSPDGGRVVTHSDDQTIRVWDAHTGASILTLRGPEVPVNSAAFSPDGKRILSTHGDNTARVWTDLAPLTSVEDPKLWTATDYCMPVEVRMRELGFSEAVARTDLKRCRDQIARVRAGR